MKSKIATQLIKKLQLQPRPEGGFFKRVYQSNDKATAIPDRYGEYRNAATLIYYLLII